MKVGFIGLGGMGSVMARRLVDAGHEVTVWNRTAAAAEPLAQAGARIAASPAAAGDGEAVIAMLADDAALDAVASGGDGLVEAAAAPILVVMGTHGTASIERLARACEGVGKALVAAPVFGRPDAAAAGRLFILAAGPRSAVAACTPLFEVMGQRVFPLGEAPQAASLVKICGNFLIASVIEGLAETTALCRKGGVEPAAFLDVLTSTLFTAPVYKTYGGLIVEEKFAPPGFAMPLGLKDVGLALAAGSAEGVPLPLASLLRDQFLAAIGRGMGGLDWSALGRLAAENAGITAQAADDGPERA